MIEFFVAMIMVALAAILCVALAAAELLKSISVSMNSISIAMTEAVKQNREFLQNVEIGFEPTPGCDCDACNEARAEQAEHAELEDDDDFDSGRPDEWRR